MLLVSCSSATEDGPPDDPIQDPIAAHTFGMASAEVDGSQLTLTFEEALTTELSPENLDLQSDFSVMVTGAGGTTQERELMTMLDDTPGDTRLKLILHLPVKNIDERITVSYSSNPERRLFNVNKTGFVDSFLAMDAINNTSDNTSGPAFSQGWVDNDKLTVVFDETLAALPPNTVDLWNDFTVMLTNGEGVRMQRNVIDAAIVLNTGSPANKLELTLMPAITNADTEVTVAYNADPERRITNAAGSFVTAFDAMNVVNRTPGINPLVAKVSGAALTISFSETLAALASNTADLWNDFTVMLTNGEGVRMRRNVIGAALVLNAGSPTNELELTMMPAITNADTEVTVAYNADPERRITDAAGSFVTAFDEMNVVNRTSGISFLRARVDGTVLTIDFNETLTALASNTADLWNDFTVMLTNGTTGVSERRNVIGAALVLNAGSPTNKLELTMMSAITNTDTEVTVAYNADPRRRITDAAGSSVTAFDAVNVLNQTSGISPLVAKVSGAALTISFNETLTALASNTADLWNDFTVMLTNEEGVRMRRNVTGAALVLNAGSPTNELELTMMSAITNADTEVTVAYAVDAERRITNAAGYSVTAFDAIIVTNSTTNLMPLSAQVSGTVVTIDFSSTLAALSSDTADLWDDFTIMLTNGATGVNERRNVVGAALDSSDSFTNRLELTLMSAVKNTDTEITVAYDAASGPPITNATGISVANTFTAIPVVNNTPDLALLAAEVNGITLTITFDSDLAALSSDTTDLWDDFTIMLTNGTTGVNERRNVVGAALDSSGSFTNRLELTLMSAVKNTDTAITVAYDATSGPPITNAAGISVANTFTAIPVVNNTPDLAHLAAEVNGIALTITFDSDLAALPFDTTDLWDDFTVMLTNGATGVNERRNVVGAALDSSGSFTNRLELTLMSAVKNADTAITVAYDAASGPPIINAAGISVVKTFTAIPVVNNTPDLSIAILPDQQIRLPDVLYGFGNGGNIPYVDNYYDIRLRVPYSAATQALLGVSDDGFMINLLELLRDSPNPNLALPNDSRITMEEWLPATHPGLFSLDSDGSLRLLEGATPILMTRLANEETGPYYIQGRFYFMRVYIRDARLADQPRLTFALIRLHIVDLARLSASAPAEPHVQQIAAASRNSFGRVEVTKPEDAVLHYELVGDRLPLIIDPLTGRLSVIASSYGFGDFVKSDSNHQEFVKSVNQIYTYSVPERSVRVAVTDQDGRRVEEDIRILPALPPQESCPDLPRRVYANDDDEVGEPLFRNDDDDSFRQWVCKNTQPIFPKDTDGNPISFVTTPAYTDALPDGLTYPKDHYKVAFADEFSTAQDDTSNPALTHLNSNFWRISGSCPEGMYLRNGNLYMTTGGNICFNRGAAMTSTGKFEFRYGYLEIRLTRIMDDILDNGAYRSLNIAYGGRFHHDHAPPRTYSRFYSIKKWDWGLGADWSPHICGSRSSDSSLTPAQYTRLQYKRILHTGGIEGNLFEYRSSGTGGFSWHVYHYGKQCSLRKRRNWPFTLRSRSGDFIRDDTGVDNRNRSHTMGVEVTPQGYLFYKNGRKFTGSPSVGKKSRGDRYYYSEVDGKLELLKGVQDYHVNGANHVARAINISQHTTGGSSTDPRPSLTIIDYVRLYVPEDPDDPGSLPYANIKRVYQ